MRTHRRSTSALVVAALLGIPAAASAQQPALTLDEAVATARQVNPDLLMQRNDQRSTRAALRSARADLMLPSAQAQADWAVVHSRGRSTRSSYAMRRLPKSRC